MPPAGDQHAWCGVRPAPRIATHPPAESALARVVSYSVVPKLVSMAKAGELPPRFGVQRSVKVPTEYPMPLAPPPPRPNGVQVPDLLHPAPMLRVDLHAVLIRACGRYPARSARQHMMIFSSSRVQTPGARRASCRRSAWASCWLKTESSFQRHALPSCGPTPCSCRSQIIPMPTNTKAD